MPTGTIIDINKLKQAIKTAEDVHTSNKKIDEAVRLAFDVRYPKTPWNKFFGTEFYVRVRRAFNNAKKNDELSEERLEFARGAHGTTTYLYLYCLGFGIPEIYFETWDEYRLGDLKPLLGGNYRDITVSDSEARRINFWYEISQRNLEKEYGEYWIQKTD